MRLRQPELSGYEQAVDEVLSDLSLTKTKDKLLLDISGMFSAVFCRRAHAKIIKKAVKNDIFSLNTSERIWGNVHF